MDGWNKKDGATSDRSKTPARELLFKPNVLPKVKIELRRKKIEQNHRDKNKKKINRRVMV
jgi:hypothetical protein